MVLLPDPVGHVRRYGPQLLGALDVEHLVVEEDVWFDFLQQGAFGCPGQEESLVDLQAPAPERLEDARPRAGGAAGRHQEGSDGAVQPLVLGVEFPLELSQGLQEALQGTLNGKERGIQLIY